MGMSPSSRRAWIEIQQLCHDAGLSLVALLAEGVDRNFVNDLRNVAVQVALLAEGVDRNIDNVLGADYITRRPPRGGRG